MSENDKKIESFWHQNPVGSNFVQYEQGRKFYEDYDEFRYKTEGHILKELDLVDFKNKFVLEIGLGQGADSMQIIKRGALYHGIDLTEESVRRLKERFHLFNMPYKDVLKANAKNIPYSDNTFDIVYSHGVIHHSPEIKQIVSEIFRVLKPGGRIVIMLYHKNSFNYYISIGLIRRVGLLFLFTLPFLSTLISKLTGESVARINLHKENFKKLGWRYLSMKEFIHKSTDGPENVYSSVWNRKSSMQLFEQFTNLNFKVHFLNERHLLGLQKIIPSRFKDYLAIRFGWHLWVFGSKM